MLKQVKLINAKILQTQIRPVARIFIRVVTWMSNLHKRTRLGESGGMLPHECSEIASEAILGQRQSFNSYLARGVLQRGRSKLRRGGAS